jgi:hypothetical protein
MLSVATFIVVLSVVLLNVSMLSNVAPNTSLPEWSSLLKGSEMIRHFSISVLLRSLHVHHTLSRK